MYHTVIGMELHAQLLTQSKMFCGCSADYWEAPPNSHVCPVCLAMPGVLPVINAQAVEQTVRTGLALNCQIAPFSVFARKNYHYPDLPKGYQISQYELPLCHDGFLLIEGDDGQPKRIGIRRAHLEEDTGKSIHVGDASLIDLNRAGVPLLEIVTEPDIRSAAEAEALARTLRAVLQYLGVNSGDMSKGVLRVEPNISVMRAGDSEYRTRTEVKNLNSIRSLYRASAYEIARQIRAWESGEGVRQATMGWDEQRQRTVVQRYKERADEYRYFPEPDLPILEASREWVDGLRARLPELPAARQRRFMDAFGLSEYDARQLVAEQAVAHYYEDVLAAGAEPKAAANWILGGLFTTMNASGVGREEIEHTRISAAQFAALVRLVEDGTLNKGTAADVLAEMWGSGADPQRIVAERGLAQVSDLGAIEAAVDAVLAANPDTVQGYLAGRDKLFGALMGQAMRALDGKGNPQAVTAALRRRLDALR